jgi:hypothetical protein
MDASPLTHLYRLTYTSQYSCRRKALRVDIRDLETTCSLMSVRNTSSRHSLRPTPTPSRRSRHSSPVVQEMDIPIDPALLQEENGVDEDLDLDAEGEVVDEEGYDEYPVCCFDPLVK